MKFSFNKAVTLLALTGILFACKNEKSNKHPDFAIVKGQVENAKDSVNLRLFNPKTSKTRMLKVDEKGAFKDTLRLEEPTYFNASYDGIFKMYVDNGMDLTLNFDGEKPSQSVKFKGKGAKENAYVTFKYKGQGDLYGDDYRSFLSQEKEAYQKQKKNFFNKMDKRFKQHKSEFDSAFIASEQEKEKNFKKSLASQRQEQLRIIEKVGEGKTSPIFENATNYEGGKNSLKDYRGSYVYIDVWATWCVPCIYEIPYLKKLEKQYEDKDITFISLSVNKPKNEDKWRKMIEDKELDGIQLLAQNGMKSEFIRDYGINGIPRFILLDKEGKVISYDAPRPSQDKLKDMFDEQDI